MALHVFRFKFMLGVAEGCNVLVRADTVASGDDGAGENKGELLRVM